jgi:hypothetical protein
MVSSLQVAERFGVLRAIQGLGAPRDFTERNFTLSEHDGRNGKNPMYWMTRERLYHSDLRAGRFAPDRLHRLTPTSDHSLGGVPATRFAGIISIANLRAPARSAPERLALHKTQT